MLIWHKKENNFIKELLADLEKRKKNLEFALEQDKEQWEKLECQIYAIKKTIKKVLDK